MSKDAQDTPPWKLERIALGEAEGSGSPSELKSLAEIEQSNQEVLQALPVEAVVQEVERRQRARQRTVPKKRKAAWALALTGLGGATVALAALLLIPRLSQSPQLSGSFGNPYSEGGQERVKGDERLLIHVQRAKTGDALELAPGQSASAGDILQLSYRAAGRRYGAIFSIDGRNTVTQHLPESGMDAVELSPRGRVALPSSYELDDAPNFERFYFITGQSPFNIRQILTDANTLADEGLELESPLRQYVFSVRKVEL